MEEMVGGGSPVNGTIYPSAARTATPAAVTLINPGYRGVVLSLDVTIASGTGGLTVNVSQIDPATGEAMAINGGGAAITTVRAATYWVCAGASGSTGAIHDLTAVPLPPGSWQVQVAHGDASSYTYSLGYQMLP